MLDFDCLLIRQEILLSLLGIINPPRLRKFPCPTTILCDIGADVMKYPG